MDVTGQNGSEAIGHVRQLHNVVTVPEREVGRTHRGALESLVHHQQPEVGPSGSPAGQGQRIRKPGPGVTADAGDSRDRDTGASDLQPHRRVVLEHVDAGMAGQPFEWDAGTLVVARNQKDRDPRVGDPLQGLERLVNEAGRDLGLVEQVAPVHHQVDPFVDGRPQRPPVVGQEVVPATPAPDLGTRGMVEAQVGVGQEEDADGARGWHGSPGRVRPVRERVRCGP